MRNRYPGICYRCGKKVKAGDGHFERYAGGWRVQHAKCAVKERDARATAEREIREAKEREDQIKKANETPLV